MKEVHPKLRWPPDRCYWAVVDLSQVDQKPSRHLIEYLVESQIPEPLESVHVAYRVLDDRSAVACIARREDLRQIDARVLSLSPTALPSHVAAPGLDPSSLELLTGAFEPSVLREKRAKLFRDVCVCVLLSVLALLWGVERRIRREGTALSGNQASVHRAVDEALGSTWRSSGLPPELVLEAETRRLQRTRNPTLEPSGSDDLVQNLSALLRSWPPDAEVQAESLLLGETSIFVTARSLASAAIEELHTSLGPLAGWTPRLPAIQRVREEHRVNLSWNRAEVR